MVRPLLGVVCLPVAFASSCDSEPTLDLCDGEDPFAVVVATTDAPATDAPGTDAATDAVTDAATTVPNLATAAPTTTQMMTEESDGAVRGGTPWFAMSLAIAGFGGRGLVFSALLGEAAAAASGSTCGDLLDTYKSEECCGQPEQEVTASQLVPTSASYPSGSQIVGSNPCEGATVSIANKECFAESVSDAVDFASADLDVATGVGPQSGGDVSPDFEGGFDSEAEFGIAGGVVPIKGPFHKGQDDSDDNALIALGPLCPVNVHWHLGAEHRSAGEYDETGVSPGKYTASYNEDPMGSYTAAPPGNRRLGDAPVRYGFACKLYDETDAKFTTEYDWQHCTDMYVGETYEVHWPHSVLGACNTPYQYQSKFYEGIFCRYAAAGSPELTAQLLASNVGVQSQVFTIVNDESYYYPNLFKGMIVTDDGDFGRDLAIYAGSSTGTGRDNTWCSAYTPITWQVDRKCHLISASSFDKMCADMKQNADDMSMDLHPHGARALVAKSLNAKKQFEEDHTDTAGHQQIPR